VGVFDGVACLQLPVKGFVAGGNFGTYLFAFLCVCVAVYLDVWCDCSDYFFHRDLLLAVTVRRLCVCVCVFAAPCMYVCMHGNSV